ncbi:MAG: SMC-Scp complex subunit ScpB [Proteobacteria bacterium]|nr:SMC-Scp complex subunit ScpB [Pseudomonadota bacterium]MBS0463201.1 SMC-Scp complex subunit ScpB [Pseudomonadota bacterium]MBS0465330.1 SMC-Scp complex subunit ScpB [Pseudomonadota bacterium]
MELAPITRIIEAALLAAQRPLALVQLAELFADEPAVTNDTLAQAIAALQEACTQRGVELVEVASGWRYQVRADVQPWVARLWAERQVKYTRATLETLALIAYRQPITRGEIEQVRGVAVNTNTIKTLEEREWIRVVGHRDVPGKPALYGTTRGFLDYFGLKSLDQLPPLAEIGEIPDLDPELPFETAPTVAIIELGADAETGEPGDGDDADPASMQPAATQLTASPPAAAQPESTQSTSHTHPSARDDAPEHAHD